MLFLKLNGTELTVSAAEVIEQVVRLAAGHLPEPEFAAWLRSRRVSEPDRG